MNMQEKMAAKLEEVAQLKDAVENGDEEAAENLAQAVEDAQEIQDAIEEAEKAEEMLEKLSTPQIKTAERAPRTLGEYAEKSLDFSGIQAGTSKSAGTVFGYKAATDPHLSVPVEVISQNVIDVPRDLTLRQLFGQESISGTTLKYFVMGTAEGAPATVAENAQKPQFHIPYTPETAPLQKIAGWYYESDELIEDNAFLRSSIDNRGLFELDKAIEKYLATTLLATSGVQTQAWDSTGSNRADDLFSAITKIKLATNYDADAIVINPKDYQDLRLAQDGAMQYYGGGYFYGPFGNGEVVRQPGLWGLNTVVTTAVAEGTALVGAFRAGASVVTKAGDGVRVEVVTGDHDDRTGNRVTVIVEERLALATRMPAAFVKVASA